MRLRLNGWQRLWVFVSGIYFLAVCGFGAFAFPDGASLVAGRTLLAIELALRAEVDAAHSRGDQRAELNALRELEKGAVRFRSEAYGDLSDAELIQRVRAKFDGKANFTPLDEKSRRDAELLRGERSNFVIQAAVWWVIPVMAVYVLGWVIGWIIRGFRNKGEV